MYPDNKVVNVVKIEYANLSSTAQPNLKQRLVEFLCEWFHQATIDLKSLNERPILSLTLVRLCLNERTHASNSDERLFHYG